MDDGLNQVGVAATFDGAHKRDANISEKWICMVLLSETEYITMKDAEDPSLSGFADK